MELLGSSPFSLLTSRVTISFLLLFCVLASYFSSSTTLSVASTKLLPGFHTLPEIAAVDDFLELGSPRDSPLRQNKKYGKKEVELGRDGRPVCEVTKFGAAGTGEKYETSAIQAAIDACADFQGGGVVYFAPGNFLTGTVFLRSNITLWIDEGATILGSPLQSHFPLSSSQWYTILAQDVENVGVTGGGVVSGQGLKFVVQFQERKNVMVSWNSTDACLGDECRPRLIGFVNCKNVHIWNLVLQDPAYWCLHILNSDRVSIHDLNIYGDFNTPNTDGIDIESSNNTVIKDCHIDTGDDAICPKTNADGPLHNLTVTDCWIRTKSCAVKLGSGTYADFHSLHFERLTIVDSHRGLGLQLRDSGSIDNVSFVNIKMSTQYYDPSWWGRAEPIYITACPRSASTKVGSISNVRFINISAISENGMFITGSKESLLRGLTFQNVSLSMKRSTNFQGGMQDYRPGCQGLIEHSTSGVFMAFVQDVNMDNVILDWQENNLSDWGLPLDFFHSSVNKISLRGFSSSYPDPSSSL
jgi:polygalacturonase